MQRVMATFRFVHTVMAGLFAAAALALMAMAASLGWKAVQLGLGKTGAQDMIEAVGVLTASVVALQISQTIIEEEVVRNVHISAPTRVRRFLSRFFIVVVVALSIEGLVASFKAVHEDLALLAYAAALLAATSLLVAAWGLFVWLNRSAEDVEPEAMEQAKQEDEKLE